jgi:8-oxo-dGTP pyrophosphatase MutT (NUDIX family)
MRNLTIAAVPEWMYRQSAVVPYREGEGGLEVLLVTSRTGKRWVLPKGVVEPGMTPAASAEKEALEEAGVRGAVGDQPIGAYCYRKWRGTCTVEVFLMRVTEVLRAWPEAGSRRREWLTLAEARERVDEADLRRILDRTFA